MDTVQDIELPDISQNEVPIWTTKAIGKYTREPSIDEGDSETGISPEDQEEEETQPVKHFPDDMHYVFCACGYVIGFGNFISFPNLVFQKGGAAFLIPYTIATIFIAVPIFFIETAWGQLVHCKLNHRFAIIHPRLWGLAAGVGSLAFFTCCYYPTFNPWFMSYFVDSFKSPFPWEKETEIEGLAWNTKYFKEDVLQISDSIDDPLKFLPYLTLLLFISYAIMYLIVRKGLYSAGEVVFYTVPIPFFLLALLIVKGFTLDGALIGIKAFFKPDWSALWDINVWESALLQSVFQIGLTSGYLMHIGAARKPKSKLIWHSFLVPFSDYIVSLIAALSIYAFLGHVSTKTGMDVEELSKAGLDLTFIAYPGLISTFQFSRMWAVVFFSMMLLIGVDSIFGILEFNISYFWDCFPSLHNKLKRENFSAVVCLGFFFLGLIFVTNNGWWYFGLFISNVGGWTNIVLTSVECLAIAAVFGIDKLDAMLQFRTGERIPKFMKFSVVYIVPPLNFALILRSLFQEFKSSGASFWGEIIRKTLRFMPIIIVSAGAIFPMKATPVETLIKKQYGYSTEELVKMSRSEMTGSGSNGELDDESPQEDLKGEKKLNRILG